MQSNPITSTSDAFAQWFTNIWQAEFKQLYPNILDFFEKHIYFVTLTLNPNKVSLRDTSGVSRSACFYQPLIDEQRTQWLRSMNILQLVSFGLSLQIPNCPTMTKERLLYEIEQKLAPKRRAVSKSKPHPLKVFEHLHYTLTKACMSNMQRKRHLQPFAVAFVDFEGSRSGAGVDPTKSRWPHIHSVIFVRPDHIPFFEAEAAVLQNGFKRGQYYQEWCELKAKRKGVPFPRDKELRWLKLNVLLEEHAERYLKGDICAVRDMQMSRYRRELGSLANLIGYSSKGISKIPVHAVRHGNQWKPGTSSGADDLYGVFPRQLARR